MRTSGMIAPMLSFFLPPLIFTWRNCVFRNRGQGHSADDIPRLQFISARSSAICISVQDGAQFCPRILLVFETMLQIMWFEDAGQSGPLKPGIRFLRPLIPALPTVFLAVYLPGGQQYGLTTFPVCHTIGLGSAYLPMVS